jgi:rare lipoprotein A (peptidoglycan hydrolase)
MSRIIIILSPILLCLLFSCEPVKQNNKTFKFQRVQSKYSKLNNSSLSKQIECIEEEHILLAKKVKLKNGKYEGYFKIGKPYKIYNILYVPKDYEEFEEVGTASWYGDAFHGKETANGETYNMKSLTAAHRTLPLPSIVKVTNLNNNKSVIVRVNDRGPFAKNRVIDLSQKAAEILEYKNKGTARVKIELLRTETDELLASLNLID